jgi:hypothetical protein
MGERGPGSLPRGGPYRESARPLPSPRRRARHRLRPPVARALHAPVVAGGLFAVVAGAGFGLVNVDAVDHGLDILPSVAAAEDATAWALLGAFAVVAAWLIWNRTRFAAPRAAKMRYVRRHLALQAASTVVSIGLVVGLRPSNIELVASTAILTTAARADGRTAYVQRARWGCSYRLLVSEGHFMAREFSVVGPFACDAPPPRLEWHASDVTLVTADGEVVGSWPVTP